MESTLSLNVDALKAEAGSFLGWGRGAVYGETTWDDSQERDLKSCVETMLRRFYFQATADPRDMAHKWTFLQPVATVALTSGEQSAPLPDDFGGFEGIATVSTTTSAAFWPVRQISEEMIRSRYALSTSIAGRPLFIAERQIKGTTPLRSNRSELYVYPEPDADYTISVAYCILPNYLTAANPYPYGGAAHAETMKAGIRAAAELLFDNEPGPESANYMQALASSIAYDRRHQPKTLGLNTDPGVFHGNRAGWPTGLWEPLGIGYLGGFTYDGQVPG